MSRRRPPGLLAAAIAIAPLLLAMGTPSGALAASPPSLPAGIQPGVLAPRVTPAAAPDLAYALYLPADYTAARRWPVLYALDSRRQGAELAELLRPAAERFGYVVVSPLGTAGVLPPESNAARLRAAWVDSHDRLALDDRRAYALAFSGMVRFALGMAAAAPGTFAGIVALNGGLPLGTAPGEEPPLPFFGVVGDRDFNYYEMLAVEERLAAAGVPHRLEIFAGSHQWPPAELVGRAVGWLELQAMREGRRTVDRELVETLWREEVERARQRDAAGDPLGAWRNWRALVADFAGLRDTAAAAARIVELTAAPAFQVAMRRHERRLERDRAYLERAPVVLHGAWGESPSVGDVLAQLDVPELQRKARGDGDPDERAAAERVLYAVYIQSALYLPRTFNERGEHRRALFYLQIAAAIDPEVPHVPHRQAVTWALLGNRREALRALERAVELGWSDAEETAAEPAFADLAAEVRFQTLLTNMRRARPAGRRRRGPVVRPAGRENGDRGRAPQASAAARLLTAERRRRRDGAR